MESKQTATPRSRISSYIADLSHVDQRTRAEAAQRLFREGAGRIATWIGQVKEDDEFWSLVVQDRFQRPYGDGLPEPRLTVGIAVNPANFENIRASNGSPRLADAPTDQDVVEFELAFEGDLVMRPRLDILTTKAPGGGGAMARFLEKFGEEIQQIEIDVTDVDFATEILRTRFGVEPIYPATRPGANHTRVNFFLVLRWDGSKVLVELIEQPKSFQQPLVTGH